jgi:hypothetical protein
MRLPLLLALFVVGCTPGLCQGTSVPQLSGYVTNVVGEGNFDVNGQHIQLSDSTTISLEQALTPHSDHTYASISPSGTHLYIGQPVEVFGKADKKHHAIAATRIVLHGRFPREVSGFAIIDAVLPLPASAATAMDHLVRADGYRILIPASAQSTFEKPLRSASDIHTNLWISFHGTQNLEGVVVANRSHFSSNIVKPNESNLEKSANYEPAAVPLDKKQSGLSKAFLGVDVKQIPPSLDAAMQVRVAGIGTRLIPKYQAGLPPSDPSRIDFRFQLISDTEDTAKWHGAIALPNGIILIPRSVVERLQNDSQIAAILADSIACALEKQPLTGHNLGEKMTAAQWGADAGAFFIPGLGIAALIGNNAVAAHAQHTTQDQSGRVALSLLNDAGFNVYQAPVAWWLLAAKNPPDLAATPLPRRAASLYQFLGESWPPDASLQMQAGPPVDTALPTSGPSGPAAPQ